MPEINKSYYAIIPANVRYDKRLSANAKLLYGEITALCNEKGYCWARNKYFADLYEVSDRSIRSWISKLIEYGYIKSEIKYADGSKEVETRLLYLPEPTPPISGGPEKNFRRGTEEIFRGGAEENFRDNNTNNNNTNINIYKKEIYKERSEGKRENEISNDSNLPSRMSRISPVMKKVHQSNIDDLISVIENYTENEELKEKLIEHLETRRIKKAAMTLSAIKESLKKLDKYSNNDEEKILMVQNAIISGWTGFYPLSYAEKKQTNKKSGKLFDKPSYDLDAYEKLDGVTAFGKLKNKSVSLGEMLKIDEEERNKEYIEVEAKEYD